MRHNLTAQFVESFRAPRNGKDREIAWDAKTPGFGLRVTAKGARTWVCMYRHNGRPRWLTLGTYPTMPLADARDQARDALNSAQQGRDPASEKQSNRAADPFAKLSERYLAEDARQNCKPRTLRDYEWIINHFLLPKWGNLKAKDVTRAEVKGLIGAIRARGATTMANRVLSMISIICDFGVREDVLDFNPASRVEKTKEMSRDRYLSADEIRTVWPLFGDALKLELLTGQRPGEVWGMRWSEVDLAQAMWTIPAERSKNGLAHRVPLVGQALTILRGLPPEGERVFPQGSRRLFERVRKVSGVDFRKHDLRRTCATGLAELGVDWVTIQKVLNHSTGGVTAIYVRHSFDDEKRDALTRWDRRIGYILTGERAKVIDLPASA